MLESSSSTTTAKFEGTGVVGTSFAVRIVLGQGTSGLAGPHAIVTFEGVATGPGSGIGTYSGEAHFGP